MANIASHRLENCLNTSYPEYYSNKGHTTFITCGKYRDVRYANDFPIFSRNEEDIKVIPNTRKKYLDNRDLILPKEKSGFTTIFKGFDFIPKPNQNDKHQDRWILTNPNTSKQLKKMTWTNIERYTMIKNNYSPLDKSKSEYFYKRRLSTANKFR